MSLVSRVITDTLILMRNVIRLYEQNTSDSAFKHGALKLKTNGVQSVIT